MTRRQILAVDRRGAGLLTVHPHWRLRVGGVAAPSLCDLRVLAALELPAAEGLLARAGCLDAVGRHESGRSLVLLAWLDRERLAGLAPAATAHPAPGQQAPRPQGSGPQRSGPQRSGPQGSSQHGSSHLWPVGCVEIRWSGPADPTVRDSAGACVEIARLYVEPRFRRHGIGRALVAAAEQHCLAAGQPRLVAALPRDAAGAATTQEAVPERGLTTAALAGYARLPGCGSTTGPLWVWRDLPEVCTRSPKADRAAERAVPDTPR